MARKRRQITVNAGDTFLITHQSNNHLYVVCSDPGVDPERIVLVNFTTYHSLEETCCIVAADEHPFIKHKSCIRYKDARKVSAEQLANLLNGPHMVQREPVSDGLLARIRNGARQSDWLPEEFRRILQNQSLI